MAAGFIHVLLPICMLNALNMSAIPKTSKLHWFPNRPQGFYISLCNPRSYQQQQQKHRNAHTQTNIRKRQYPPILMNTNGTAGA